MTLGIGLFAPCMILVALLGMNETTALPDHDGLVRVPDAVGVGALPALGALRSARRARPDPRRAAGGARRGFIVKSLPLATVKWLVVVRRRLHCDRDAALRRQSASIPMASRLFATKSVDALRADAAGDARAQARARPRSTSCCWASARSSAPASSCSPATPRPTTPARRSCCRSSSPAIASGFAGLCYAEMASMIPIAGSAYTYSYATMGELVAWIIGWDLILEYMVGAATVSVGWSGYVVAFVHDVLGIDAARRPGRTRRSSTTRRCGQFHATGAVLNVPAMLITAVGDGRSWSSASRSRRASTPSSSS